MNRREYFRRGAIQVGGKKYLQLSGNGNDQITDIKKLSTGQLIVAGWTLSTTFCGIDVSSYTGSGTYRGFFILKIDASLPSSGYLLGSYFLNGSGGKTFGSGRQLFRPSIEIGADDNIYYTWGDDGSDKSGWKIYGVRSSDMTLQYNESGTAMGNVYYGAAVHKQNPATGDWFIGYDNVASYQAKVRQMNSSLAYQNEQPSAVGYWITDAFINGSMFTFDGLYNRLRKISLTTLLETAGSDLSATFSTSTWKDPIVGDSSSVYIASLKNSDNDWVVGAYNQSNLAAKTGWTNYTKSVAAGKTAVYCGLTYTTDGKLLLLGYSNDGSTGATDLNLVEINPATGAEVASNKIKINGTNISQATKNFQAIAAPLSYGTNQYFIAGYTDGNLPNFTNGGSYDAIIIKVDATGECIV